MDRPMNYSDLFTVERFRPAQPALALANDRGARRPSALVRPNGDGTRTPDEEPVEIHRFVDLKAKREALHYTIDGVVRRGRIYTLTGPTGDGKTALCMTAALAVATGRADILGLDVEKGRVLYLAIENPEDTVSRFTIAQHFHRILNPTLHNRLFIVKSKATPEAVFAALKDLAKSGPFALVIVDTLAAFFDGTDMNDNVAVGSFMRRLRALTTVLGNPAIVVPAHPTKLAAQGSLIPYGGGAIVNEVDGNLTLWRRGNVCRLHWQTKFRGPDFAPVFYRFREYGCDEVRDAKGRRVIMPLLVPLLLPLAEEPAKRLALPAPTRFQPRLHHEQRRSDAASPDVKLLRAMIADPNGTQAKWAAATGVVKSNVNRRLMRLEGEGLVQRADGRWTVTPAGKRTV
jgi:archaellum biogenesis ATPase FlaH